MCLLSGAFLSKRSDFLLIMWAPLQSYMPCFLFLFAYVCNSLSRKSFDPFYVSFCYMFLVLCCGSIYPKAPLHISYFMFNERYIFGFFLLQALRYCEFPLLFPYVCFCCIFIIHISVWIFAAGCAELFWYLSILFHLFLWFKTNNIFSLV